jgi:peptidoglycan biosynthesis protein MviN/MurJ (putative lipid II flippase)
MIGGMAVHTVTVFMTPMFYASKRTGIHVIAYLLMATVNLIIDLALVPQWGVMGAATGKFCADITGLLVHGWWFKRIFGAEPTRAALWGWPCWLVMAAVLCGTSWLVSLAVWSTGSCVVLMIAKRSQQFDEASAAFYEKLGLPKMLSGLLVGSYRRWLVPARA